MNIMCHNLLINTINEFCSLQYDCYLQLGLLIIMVKSFVVRSNFIFMMLWVSVVKFGINPLVEPRGGGGPALRGSGSSLFKFLNSCGGTSHCTLKGGPSLQYADNNDQDLQ